MSKIIILDKLISQYRLWTIKLRNASQNIEDNILQKDSANKFEEKIISIGIASIFVYICTGVVGLFGVATGGFAIGLVLFAIGWLLSKLINKKIFGTERKIEDVSSEEQYLLEQLSSINNTHNKLRDNINSGLIIVNFTSYSQLKQEFQNVINLLSDFNVSHLAYKYRFKHLIVTSKYKQQVNKFDAIYAHKQGVRKW